MSKLIKKLSGIIEELKDITEPDKYEKLVTAVNEIYEKEDEVKEVDKDTEEDKEEVKEVETEEKIVEEKEDNEVSKEVIEEKKENDKEEVIETKVNSEEEDKRIKSIEDKVTKLFELIKSSQNIGLSADSGRIKTVNNAETEFK